MKKRIAIGASLLLLGTAGGLYYYYSYAPGREGGSSTYRTERLARGTIREAINATGTVNPVTTVQVGTQVSGTLKEVLVDFNSAVRAGQVIARIDPRLFDAAVAQARGNHAAAEAALAGATVRAEDAARTLARTAELHRQGFAPQAEYDSALTADRAAQAQVRAAEAQLAQARGALEVALANLRYTTIHSPIDGIVIGRNVDVGQTVAASFQTPTLFTIARDLTRMQVDTNVDEADVGKARPGLRATFTVDAFPGREFAGEVVQVRNSPVVSQNVVTYNVVVRVDNPEALLKPGMTANVSILVRTLDNVLRIPNSALRFRPRERADEDRRARGGETVHVLGKNGKPAPVSVRTGVSDGTFTELVSGEIPEGTAVVTGETAPRGGRGGSGNLPGMGGFR